MTWLHESEGEGVFVLFNAQLQVLHLSLVYSFAFVIG